MRILVLFLVSVKTLVSISQDKIWNHYTVKEGLPSSNVYKCVEDNEGFIWIGTESGLSRFDGAKFTNYTAKDGLTDNEVLWVDFNPKTSEVKIVTFNSSITYYNTKTKKFNTSKETDKDIFSVNQTEILKLIPVLSAAGIGLISENLSACASLIKKTQSCKAACRPFKKNWMKITKILISAAK